MAERIKAPFFFATVWSQSRNLGSTPTLVAYAVGSLYKALYDDYLCLVALNKQQIKWLLVKETSKKLWNEQLLSGCGFVQKYSATVAFSWQEDSDGSNKQTNKQYAEKCLIVC